MGGPTSLYRFTAPDQRARHLSLMLAGVVSLLAVNSCSRTDAPSRGDRQDTPVARVQEGAPLSPPSEIAFVSAPSLSEEFGPDRSQGEIYLIDSDGSGLRNLTNHPAHYDATTWSPDGTRLGFVIMRDGGTGIYAMSADGSGLTRLTENDTVEYWDRGLAWSPDGTRIAFASSRSRSRQIHVVNTDGSGRRSLSGTEAPNDHSPTWSPDGTRIAFARVDTSQYDEESEAVNGEIYVVNADGSGLRRLTTGFGVGNPAWSPDGTTLAFACPGGVCVMSADGTGRRSLATGYWVSCLAWSPDGTRVAFQSNANAPREPPEIWVVNADGSGVRQLVIQGQCPAWSPDGNSIAYERCCRDTLGIYVVDVNSAATRRLTGEAWYPTWRPASRP